MQYKEKNLNFEKESSDNYTEDKRHVSLSMSRYWALALKKRTLGPLIFRLETHEIYYNIKVTMCFYLFIYLFICLKSLLLLQFSM